MVPLVLAFLGVLCPSLISGQASKQVWSPDDLYNPLQEPRKCGLNSDEPAYVCDPNRVLGDHIHSINWILKDAAYNSTKCPCSNYYCETEKGATGYRIGVALVKRMKIEAGTDGRPNTPQDQAQLFAYRLENTRWNMGHCEEDIIIFYSLDDKMLAMYGGATATAKLTPYYRDLLAYKVGKRLDDGRVIEAFNNLLYDLKLVLNCETLDEHDCGLHEIRSGASSFTVSAAVALSAVLFSLYISFM